MMEEKDVEEKIQKWLLQEGYSVKGIEYPNSSFSYKFNFDGNSPNFLVAKLKNKVDSVMIINLIGWDKDGNQLMKLGTDERKETVSKIRMDLCRMHCNFAFQTTPGTEVPHGIVLSKTLYYDGLSKHNFFDAISTVRSSGIVVSEILFDALGIKPSEPTKATKYIE